MTAFDVDAWLEAQEAWTVVLRRRRYRADPISVVAVFAFQQEVDRLRAADDAAGYQRAVERLLREAFPYRWRMLWQGDPVRRILGLGLDAQQAVLRDFFDWTARRITAQIPTATPPAGTAFADRIPPPMGSETAPPVPRSR